jgi:hypothetical protein
MKTNSRNISVTLLLCATLIAQYSCKKDKNDESFVDGYNPTLTEKAGITYDGDYFPLNTGYNWDWQGQSTNKGTYEDESVNETDDVSGYMYIVQQKLIVLPSGSYTVYQTSETHGIERYFEKTASTVNLRAINNLDGSDNLIEVKNPCYIKMPLVVGDKWVAQPQIDNQLLSTIEDIDISNLQIKCNFYVIGKENIIWKGQSTETIRIEERAEISGKAAYDDEKINVSATIMITLNLCKNIGVIMQKEDLNVTTSGDVKMNMNVKSNIALTNYSLNEIPTPPEVPVIMKYNVEKIEELPGLKSANPTATKIQKLIQVLKRACL